MDLPVPDEVRPCVESKVAGDPEVLAQVSAVGPGGALPGAVMDVAAACMREQRALPAFIRALEAQLGRSLSADQRDCVSSGYLAIPADALAAAEADALGAPYDRAAATQLGDVVAKCGVDVDAK